MPSISIKLPTGTEIAAKTEAWTVTDGETPGYGASAALATVHRTVGVNFRARG
jgi:hypothetical protein